MCFAHFNGMPRWLRPVERQPRKLILSTLDWEGFREYVSKKFSPRWAKLCFSYAHKYAGALENPSMLEIFGKFKKNNVLKALIALAKYHGFYREFKERIKDCGIKWSQTSSIDSFLRILRNENKNVLAWYRQATSILTENCSTYLKFLLMSGLRVSEALESFNLIRMLQQQGQLGLYHNEELKTLEHFRFKEKFLRNTKNAFITMVPKSLVLNITQRNKVTYPMIRMKLRRQGIPLKMNELRDFYATFMVRHGLIKEEVDLLQGRVGESIFIRHYWSPAMKELQKRVIGALNDLMEILQ